MSERPDETQQGDAGGEAAEDEHDRARELADEIEHDPSTNPEDEELKDVKGG